MSAICSNTDWHAVKDDASKATAQSITARPTRQEKRLFAAIAAKRQLSESTLALIAIRSLIDSDVPGLRLFAHHSRKGLTTLLGAEY